MVGLKRRKARLPSGVRLHLSSMESEVSYGKRLHKAAREDFKTFWSGHRSWVTFSTLISPFLVQVKVLGWASLLTGYETLESAVLALGLSLAGNYVIALWGGAKSLDAGSRAAIAERDKQIHQREKEISGLSSKPHRTPAEEHHFREAEAMLQKLPDAAKSILQYSWTNNDLRPSAERQGIRSRPNCGPDYRHAAWRTCIRAIHKAHRGARFHWAGLLMGDRAWIQKCTR
jgi:hypothetical protein